MAAILDASVADPRTPRAALWVEFVLLYVGLPVALAGLRARGFHVWVLPVLWLASVPTVLWLRRRAGFTRRDFLGWQGWASTRRGVAVRVVAAGLLLAALVLCCFPDQFLELPRTRPRLWALVMLLYPLLSVYPQGLVYRALYQRRYAGLWPDARAARLAGAVVFSLAHIVFLNAWALVLTLVGGWWFGRTYERTGSLAVSNLEHAAAGCLVFTFGMGRFLYHGTQAMLSHVSGGG